MLDVSGSVAGAGISATRRKPHIWTIEGNWSSSWRDVRSVDPVLVALKEAKRAEHIKRHVNTVDDLVAHMKAWGQAQHARFEICYLALHGSPGAVHIGRKRVALRQLADALPAGILEAKTLYVGSCSVLNLDDDEVADLHRALGVKVLCGYTNDVEWFPALAFELLLFDALAHYTRPTDARRYLERRYGDLYRDLGFMMATPSGVYRADLTGV